MTVEELAKLSDWARAGDIRGCDVGHCHEEATKFADIRKGIRMETWYFCKKHFAEYLRATDDIREQRRNIGAA